MLKDLINKENLLNHAAALKKKRFRPGFDGMTMEGANSWIHINGDRLCRDIINKNYRPMPAVGFRTAKQHGGFRSLSKITAIDTIVQKTLYDELESIAEKIFLDNSFAYRPSRGIHVALENYIAMASRHRFVSKFDFNACFENIDHSVLQTALNLFFDDTALCELCMTFVKTPIFIDGEIMPTEKGLLQGMPLAPLFCNVYFHTADCFLSELGIPFIRYADDIVVFGDTPEEMEKLNKEIFDFFEKELLLTCNRKKTKTDSPAKISFLGYRFVSDKKGLTAVDINTQPRNAYNFWQSHSPINNHRRVDLISDGILRQKNASLIFDTDFTDTAIPVVSTDIINVYSDVILDSNALNCAFKNGVSINVFDNRGEYIGSFLPNSPLKSPRVTHEQLRAYYNKECRMELAKDILLASIHNENIVIRYYNKQNPDSVYQKALNCLQTVKAAIKSADSIEDLRMLEARARKEYYSCFDHFIKHEEFVFEKRTRKPPKNMVNSLISFGNTMLYNHIATEIQKTPLDVRVGFLHSTTTRLKSLNLDLAEIFKPLIVDRTVFSLINKREITPAHFISSDNGAVYLNAEGKKIFINALRNKFDVTLQIKTESMTYRQIIVDEVRKLVRYFRHEEKYKAYRQVR